MANYKEFLEELGDSCPFCNVDGKTNISENSSAFLRLSKAPYLDDHLLVIPKRHVISLFEVTPEELVDINKLIKEGIKLIYERGESFVSVLVREGEHSSRSIPHMHYHLIPKVKVSTANQPSYSRKVISNDKELSLVNEFKKLIN